MEDNKRLKELGNDIFKGERIMDWKFYQVGDDFMTRVYHKEYATGFYFYAVEIIGQYSGKSVWDEDNEAECIFHGSAAFDGVRHLYMGRDETDNYGYHYYPDFDQLIGVLYALKALEKKYCSEKMED